MDTNAEYKELMEFFGNKDVVLERPIKFRNTPHSKEVIINVIEVDKSISSYGHAQFTVLQRLKYLKYKEKNNRCGILYPSKEHKDHEGCLKPDGHNDSHVFKNDKNEFIAWEDDADCTCGCWETYEKDGVVCILHWKIEK